MLQPTKGRVLLRRYRRPETFGKIIIPESCRDDLSGLIWEVESVGRGRLTQKGVEIPPTVATGDLVILPRRFTAVSVTIDRAEDDVYVVDEEMIDATLEED